MTQRYLLTNKGNAVDMECSLMMDICRQDRLILNGVALDIKIFPSSDSFVLLSGDDTPYQYKIDEAVMKVCQVKVNPGVLVGHAVALKKSPAIYPIIKSDVKSFNIPAGSYSWSTDDLFQGQVPDTLIVTMTSAASYSGTYGTNPFCFKHYNVNQISFSVDGESLPAPPMMMDYKNGNYISAYLSTFSSTDEDQSNYIERGEYPNGNAIYVFRLNQNDDGECVSLLKRGHTRLQIRFTEALPEAATVITYAKFPAIVHIDESRNVIT